jgi:hypothetical protein
MQFIVPTATTKRSKYDPRHFRILADHFCGIEWHESVQSLTPGDWTMVVRSPGYHGLGRTTARQHGIDCAFDLISSGELERLKHQGGRVLVDLGWEMLNPMQSVVSSLADTLKELDIAPARVFILHSNQNARGEFVRHWMATVGTEPPYSLEYPVAMALCVVHHQKCRDDRAIAERREFARKRTSEGSRSRLFTSFNGEVRPHRLYLAAALEHLGLLERGYFSLVYPRKSANETEDKFHDRTLALLRKLGRGPEFADAGARILKRLPMELDIAAVPPGGIEELAWVSQDPHYYDDSRFSVVIDSVVSDSTCLFVTEKVLKPVLNHHPFLLVGSSGGANLLRAFGFRTFEPYIRQCETGGFEDVLNCAVEEIQRLSRLGDAELDDLSRNLASTCDYNALHFWDGFPEILKRRFEECLLSLGPPMPSDTA